MHEHETIIYSCSRIPVSLIDQTNFVPTTKLTLSQLKTNRTGQASTVLGAVRARHNELQRIEATLTDLAAMFADMAQIVEAQEDVIVNTENSAIRTVEHVDQANIQIEKAKDTARNRRKLKWWCLWISLLILIIVVIIVVVVVEVNKKN